MPISTTDLTAIRRAIPTDHDITLRQLHALALIVSKPQDGRTVRALAAAMQVHRPAITRAADRLEDFGFVVRRPDTADRRSVFFDATAAGRRFASRHLVA